MSAFVCIESTLCDESNNNLHLITLKRFLVSMFNVVTRQFWHRFFAYPIIHSDWRPVNMVNDGYFD